MFGNLVKFERLDMRKRFRFSETWNCSQCGPRTGTDDHVRAMQLSGCPIRESGLQSCRSYESPGSQYEIRSRLVVIRHVHLVQAGYHLALAITDTGHINLQAAVRHAKFLTSAKVGCDLRTVNDVLTRQARDVRAGPANIFAFDDCDPLPFCAKCPRCNC